MLGRCVQEELQARVCSHVKYHLFAGIERIEPGWDDSKLFLQQARYSDLADARVRCHTNHRRAAADYSL